MLGIQMRRRKKSTLRLWRKSNLKTRGKYQEVSHRDLKDLRGNASLSHTERLVMGILIRTSRIPSCVWKMQNHQRHKNYVCRIIGQFSSEYQSLKIRGFTPFPPTFYSLRLICCFWGREWVVKKWPLLNFPPAK